LVNNLSDYLLTDFFLLPFPRLLCDACIGIKIVLNVFQDFPKAIKKVAKFLGKTYNDEEINKVANYLKIENFRNNPMVNGSELRACSIIDDGNFVRKGGIDGWKDLFTPELNTRADKWIEKNLRDTDLRFPFFQ